MSFISVTIAGSGGDEKFAFDPYVLPEREIWKKLARFKGMRIRMKNMKPAMDAALGLMVKNEKQVFATEGASIGARWRAYTEDEKKYYLPIKRAMLGGVKPMLRWSASNSANPAPGEILYPSLLRKNLYSIAKSTKDGFEYGTSVPYASNHQYGRGSYKGKYQIIQRKLLAISKQTKIEIVREMQRHIFGKRRSRRMA